MFGSRASTVRALRHSAGAEVSCWARNVASLHLSTGRVAAIGGICGETTVRCPEAKVVEYSQRGGVSVPPMNFRVQNHRRGADGASDK